MIEGEFYLPSVNECLDLYGLLCFEDFELNSVRKSGCLLFFQFLHCMLLNGFILTYLYAVISRGFWWKSCLKTFLSRFCEWSCMFGFICGGIFSGFWVEFFYKKFGLFCFSIFSCYWDQWVFFIPIYAVVAPGFWKESWVFYVSCNFWKFLQIFLCLDFYMLLVVVFWSVLFDFLKEKKVWCFFSYFNLFMFWGTMDFLDPS